MTERAKRYRSFISYSQKDKGRARRLHQALERYRLPKGVQATGVDARARKLGRFFRDDEEMGAATDLGAALQGAIADADNLIVVCSPNAAQSEWVNKEIIHFKRTGRDDNIFAVIVAGTPNSGDEHECFPPALRFALGKEGALSDQRVEPLAVDLRKERFARVLTRLVAGLVQTPFDELWRREQRRAAAQRATLSFTVLLIAFILGGALTQHLWYPPVDAYWRYQRHAHSTEALMAAAPGTTFQDCRGGSSDCPVMVVISEGTFLMGDAPEQTGGDQRRRISIARFAVSQNEIAFADWQRCFDAGACGIDMPDRSGWAGENLPVINVSWEHAQKYVAWLSRVTGYEYRLLTEAEWEYAARGVTSADDPRNSEAWGFGNDESQLGRYAWFGGNSAGQTHPVGTLAASRFGLHDMHGNVWEWVEDCYAPYDLARLDGAAVETGANAPNGAERATLCSLRVLRGGSWNYDDPYYLRSAFRLFSSPALVNSSYNVVGFRVARTL